MSYYVPGEVLDTLHSTPQQPGGFILFLSYNEKTEVQKSSIIWPTLHMEEVEEVRIRP